MHFTNIKPEDLFPPPTFSDCIAWKLTGLSFRIRLQNVEICVGNLDWSGSPRFWSGWKSFTNRVGTGGTWNVV